MWIPNGEDAGGLYDRLIMFPSKYAKECNIIGLLNTESMNVIMKGMYKNNNRSISYIRDGQPITIGNFNSEIYHKIFYEWNKILYKVRRSPLLNFLIAVEGQQKLLKELEVQNSKMVSS